MGKGINFIILVLAVASISIGISFAENCADWGTGTVGCTTGASGTAYCQAWCGHSGGECCNVDETPSDGCCMCGGCPSCTGDGGSCSSGSSCCSGMCIEGTCRSACSSTYSGNRCSNDGNSYTNSASGVCARNYAGTWSCDKDEVAYTSSHFTDCFEIVNGAPTSSTECDTDVDPSYSANGMCSYTTGGASTSTVNCDTDTVCSDGTYYRSQCSYCYSSGSTARYCDYDVGTSYSADGLCVSGGSCDNSGHACYDGSAYQASCSSCGYTLTDNDACDTSITDGSYTANGMCVSGGSCTSGTVCNLTNTLYSGCASCYTTGTAVGRCDSDGGTSFSANGICVSGGTCDNSGHACYDDSAYQSSCSSCSLRYSDDAQGDSCDTSITDTAYTANGLCTYSNTCTPTGSTIRVDADNSNYFIAGCDNGSGDICTSNSQTLFSQTGLCVAGSLCDGTDVALDSGIYYGNCSGHGGRRCQKTITSGVFSQTGMCFDLGGATQNTHFNCVLSGFITYNGTHYKNSSQIITLDYDYDIDTNGKSCDSTITSGGDYSANGMVTTAGVCTASGSVVRIDADNNNYFTAGCDNSADACGTVASSLNAPWAKSGVCCSNSCVGTSASVCCIDSECDGNFACMDYQCVNVDGFFNITNLGITGIEQTNNEYTSQRAVFLNMNFTSVAATCRYANYDSQEQPPAVNSDAWNYWEPCIVNRAWLLNDGAGLKRVFLQVNYTYSGVSKLKNFSDTIYYNYTGAGLDTTPPETPEINMAEFSNNNLSVSLSWSSYDPESIIFKIPLSYNVTLYLNNHTTIASIYTTSTSASVPVNLPNGTIVYANVSSINSAGLKNNASTYPSGMIIDLDKPYISSLSGRYRNASPESQLDFNLPTLPGWLYTSFINFTWAGWDGITSEAAAYSYLLTKDANSAPDDVPEGNQASLDLEKEKIYQGLGSGKYYFKVKAKDKSGNWGDPLALEFWVDITPPARPIIISSERAEGQITYIWSASTDPESLVAAYNITLYDSSGNSIESVILPDSAREYTFTGLSAAGEYNATVGAMNNVGLWAWSDREIYYADFTPPSISASPTNVVSTQAPTIKAYTDEQATCYYNDILFAFTNTTYHEAKSENLADGDYTYTIRCEDIYNNYDEIQIDFTVDTTRMPDLISIPTEIYAYQGAHSFFSVYVTSLGIPVNGISEGRFKLNIDGTEMISKAVETGEGEYKIAFEAPEAAGQYALGVSVDGSVIAESLLIAEKLSLSAAYSDLGITDAKKTARIIYQQTGNNLFGIATDAEESLIGASVSPGEISMEPGKAGPGIFIFNTVSGWSISQRDNMLKDKSFLEKSTPSFGYPVKDNYIVQVKLNYDNFEISSDQESIKKGRYNYLIKNQASGDKKEFRFIRK